MSHDLSSLSAFLHREARLLDDRRWDEWLGCYSPDAEFWMPSWTDDDTLVTDPQTQISLIYYPNRQGLEDRVYRLKTERSAASSPLPRTTHMIANIELLGSNGGSVELRYNWHTLSHRLQRTSQFFGTTSCSIAISGPEPLITRKTIILNNDYIHQVIDIYHV